MSRLSELNDSKLSSEQKRILAQISNHIGTTSITGPFRILLRLPQIDECADEFYYRLRKQGKLDRRLGELIALIVSRFWKAQFIWTAHSELAIKAGISREDVEAIRSCRRPNFLQRNDEKVVYDMVTELCETKGLTEESYSRAFSVIGSEELMIEISTTVGFFTMLAILLNTFDVPGRGGEKPLL